MNSTANTILTDRYGVRVRLGGRITYGGLAGTVVVVNGKREPSSSAEDEISVQFDDGQTVLFLAEDVEVII